MSISLASVVLRRAGTLRRIFLGGLVLLTSCAPFAVSESSMPRLPKDEIRALWVTRWDYKSPEDVRRIVANARWAGFNRLFFQVRGDGTCMFPSAVEPWSWELTGDVSLTGKNPGWDPLALAIAEAHRQGIQLHAYMNVMPGWKNVSHPPRSSGQLIVSHPDWFMMDAKGRYMDPATCNFYACVNPARQDVRDYLVRLFSDVAARYPDLDGVHLDYIRYPGEAGDFSYDAESLSQFRAYSGGASPAQARDKWNEWRARQVNRVLAEITRAMRQRNPRLEVSAAVVADYREAVENKAQRSLQWPELGLVDTLVPMAYHYDPVKYGKYLDTFLGATRPKTGKVLIGIWPAPKWYSKGYTYRMMLDQIQSARRGGADGVAVFAYSRFFPDHKPGRWAEYLKTQCFGIR